MNVDDPANNKEEWQLEVEQQAGIVLDNRQWEIFGLAALAWAVREGTVTSRDVAGRLELFKRLLARASDIRHAAAG